MATEAPKRRWLSFSIRTLLLVVLVSCVACGWFAMLLQKARIQRESVEAIEQLGGEVLYDFQEDRLAKPRGPIWLRRLLGGHFFDRVVRVDFTNRGIPNDRVTDISFLSGMDKLRILYLDGTAVRDISLLADTKVLSFLSLNYTKVEDLSPLAHLQKLESISLDRTNVRDLSPVSSHRLKRVWLRGTKIRDISALTVDELISLDLYKTHIRDISSLSSANKLETLSLNWTNVNDVTPLIGLTRLRSLDIRRTKVTVDSARELQNALPDCKILGP